jgi:dipeptidyl aminopeptidase/acylaminoacyl peptidase
MKIKTFLFSATVLFYVQSALSQKQINYQVPDKSIVKLVDAPTTPQISIDPKGEWMLQLGVPGFPDIAEVSAPELRIAGIRINPLNFNQSRQRFNDSLVLTNLKSGKDFTIDGLPEPAHLANFRWSPNGLFVAFTHTSNAGLELWLLDVKKHKAQALTDGSLNGSLPGSPFQWIDEGQWLVYQKALNKNQNPPKASETPTGPVVQESQGKESAIRTYQDLLKNEFDEELFAFYTHSQLVKINIEKESYPIGIEGIFKSIEPSPDGRFLYVEMIHKPFSYLVPYYYFPFKCEIWDNEGGLFRELFDIPSAENLPKGFGAVPKAPRNISWRSDKPATIYWVKAMDGGDPNKESVIRDRLFTFDFPFDGTGTPHISFNYRYGGIDWGTANTAICREWWWNTRTEIISMFNPDGDASEKQILFEYNWQDEYKHPGNFITTTNEAGHAVLAFSEKGNNLYLKGRGATPEGYKPFVDKYNVETQKKERMWQSGDPYYEYPITFTVIKKEIILTRRESKTDPPNYFSRNLDNGVVSQLSNYPNPYPQMQEVRSELIKYKRKDGVQLTGKLYTPPGYSVGDGFLPTLMWAYPSEYKSAATAGQVKDSPNQFVRLGWWSPIFWVMRGYAVFDDPSMPIIGEGDNEPNDTFIEQLVADAEAAVQCLDSLAIIDKNRVAIGGHSYGAFMTANLLAHSDLFAAGIARSGAYNRTLTPFGFQAEERTFWEARDTYINMSPFSFADKINEPILLIHGDADNNSGTFPLQSERFFTAIKGNGGNVRLVMLPAESHSYQARESILHMLWEMDRWLEKNVKQKQ